MKKLLPYIMLVLALPTFAQQDPMYSQYLFNPAALNPAEAGKTENLNIFLISRHQWLTFDGGPSTQSIGADLPLNGTKAGLGLVFISDRLGPTMSNIMYMDYAYRLDINNDLKLDMGLRSGITLFGANFTDLESHEQDDDLLMNDIKSKAMANFGFGASLYSKDFFASVSAPKLLKNKIDSEGNALSESSQLVQHFFLSGGYKYRYNNNIMIEPAAIAKFVSGAPISLDVSANLVYNEVITGGIMYRIGDALGLLFQYEWNEMLCFGYSVELSMHQMGWQSVGTHEILFRYKFKPKNEVWFDFIP